MKQLATTTPAGTLELSLESAEFLDAARELVAAHAADSGSFAGPVDFAGRRAWMKSSFLAGRARLRHTLLHRGLRAPLPRVREAWNARWLEAHGFRVPHPLAAGALGGFSPRWQFLVNEFVAGTPLDAVLRDGEASERAPLLFELASETARLHALDFVHRDLFWRNVLVRVEPAPRRLVFIDAWRGGARLQWRTAAYDLACLFLEAPSLLDERELRAWLAAYASERAAHGAPIEKERLWHSASAARGALVARVRREPGRWRIPEALVQEFDFAVAAR